MASVKPVDTVVQLSVHCKGLRSMDRFSKSDPMCVLYKKCGMRGSWTEVGRTETVTNSEDPEWATVFTIHYYFHEKQSLKFAVYDVDNDSGDLMEQDDLGTAECSLAQILSESDHKLELCLSPYRNVPGDCGIIYIRAVEVSDGTRDRVTLDLTAQNLDKKDLFSESDPFYLVYRKNEDGEDTLVYRSEWIRNTANPDWKPVTMDCAKLCCGDWFRPLRIEVYDWDMDGGHDFIGECTTTLEELSEGEGFQILQYDLINKKKQERKKSGSYSNSGQIVVKSVNIQQDSTFLDYIRGGLKLNLVVGVDLTSSNGSPDNPKSLHHLSSRHENAYTTAIRAVGEILQDYDYDKKVLGLGFGAEVGRGKVSHVLPLNNDPRHPYCIGVDELVNAYINTVRSVRLSEPTRYSDLLEYVVENLCNESGDDEYTIVLLITDGGVTDFEETKRVLVQNSHQPLSVVLVGVGDGDMGALNQLDSDRARLSSGQKPAARDIVQFVQMNRFFPNGCMDPNTYHTPLDPMEAKLRLARAVLAEIPRQVTEYMQKAGRTPKLPDIPFDLSEDFDKRFNM